MITQEYLKAVLHYNEETGIFTKIKDGKIAGCLNKSGYSQIRIDNKLYYSHRLAWLYIYGNWPIGQIDHINGSRNDNTINNLRDVTHRQNNSNKPEHRMGKLYGCSFDKSRNKWVAKIEIKAKCKHLGRFNTEQEAHEAYCKYLKSLN